MSDPTFAKVHSDVTALEAVRLHFAEHAADWKELEEATNRPYARFPVSYNYQPSYAIQMSHLSGSIHIAQGASLKATAEFAEGNSTQALTTLQIVFKWREALAQEPMLISQLVNHSMVVTLLQPVWEALEARSLTAAELDALSVKLASIDLLNDYRTGMRGENVFFASTLDYLKSSNPSARSQVIGIVNQLGARQESPENKVTSFIWRGIALATPKGWYDLNKTYGTQFIQSYCITSVDLKNRRVDVKKIREGDTVMQHMMLGQYRPTTLFVRLALPAMTNSLVRFTQQQACVDMARISCALEKYYLQQHRYPATLEALGDSLPHDVMTGVPYHYQLTSGGRYKLWSVGWNETDDGGKWFLKKGNDHLINEKAGDWVWSYTPR